MRATLYHLALRQIGNNVNSLMNNGPDSPSWLVDILLWYPYNWEFAIGIAAVTAFSVWMGYIQHDRHLVVRILVGLGVFVLMILIALAMGELLTNAAGLLIDQYTPTIEIESKASWKF